MLVAMHDQIDDKQVESTVSGDKTFSGDNTHSGDTNLTGSAKIPSFADDTARDAVYTSPRDGDVCTNAGDLQHYNATTVQRETVDTGTPTPNASETVAGKVEIATTAEVNAGTDTGGTGATNVVIPSTLVSYVTDNKYAFENSAISTTANTRFQVTHNL